MNHLGALINTRVAPDQNLWGGSLASVFLEAPHADLSAFDMHRTRKVSPGGSAFYQKVLE